MLNLTKNEATFSLSYSASEFDSNYVLIEIATEITSENDYLYDDSMFNEVLHKNNKMFYIDYYLVIPFTSQYTLEDAPETNPEFIMLHPDSQSRAFISYFESDVSPEIHQQIVNYFK